MLLDKREPIELESARESEYANELYSLEYLSVGLSSLCGLLKQYQQKISATAGTRRFTFGFDPVLDSVPEIPKELIICAFHWYAISSCNYVRLVGMLGSTAISDEPDRRAFINSYITRVLPAVKPFRDKIAAHFSFSAFDPIGRDNLAEQRISKFIPLSIQGNVIRVMPLVFHTGSGEEESESSALQSWSMTETHEDLKKRYTIFC